MAEQEQATIRITRTKLTAPGYAFEAAVYNYGRPVWSFYSDHKQWAQVQAEQYWPKAIVIDETEEASNG